MAQTTQSAARRGVKLAMAFVALCWPLVGPVACVDGGPHPEPPDPLGPPSAQVDSGIDRDDGSDEEVTGGGTGGAAGAGAGVGGSGGGGGDIGESPPTECMDAAVDGGWLDEDAGALR